MRQTRKSLNTNNAVAQALRAMAAVARQPIAPGCIAAFAGSLPTGQSAAAKHPPLRRLQKCAPEVQAGNGPFDPFLCAEPA